MRGMDAATGKPLEGTAHLIQSIGDILSTPIGTRVMRRDYGSLLPELVDQPANDFTRLRLFAATAIALLRWEPRLRLKRVRFAPRAGDPGAFDLDLEGERTDVPPANSLVRLTFPLRMRGSRQSNTLVGTQISQPA